jgi:hypothetical protein
MESEMRHIQRLAILSSAIALSAAPAGAAPTLANPGAPEFAIQVQSYVGRADAPSIPGIGAFWGGGGGFGGGRYNSWPATPPPSLPPYRPRVYNTYQPPPQPQAQPQPPAPVVADVPYREPTSVRKTTFARPIPNAQPNFLATLSGVRGDDVSVRSVGGTFANIASGRQLKAADALASGPDTEVTLTLRDGGAVHLSPATLIDLAPLDSKQNNAKVLVDLETGEVSSQVSLGATTGYNFAVKTDRAIVDVREAAFTVRHDKQTGVTTVSVEEGVVQVTPTNKSLEPVGLRAGQQAQIAADHVNVPAPADESAGSAAADPVAAAVPDATAKVVPASAVAPMATASTVPAATPTADSAPVTAASSGAASALPAADAAPTATVASVAPAAAVTPAATVGSPVRATDSAAVATAAGTAPAATPATTDLTGSWLMQDGRVVQLTQSGNQVSWSYRGSAGHEALAGTISGTFDGRFLVGTFQYKEGDSVGNGTVTLTMDGSNRLVGGWVATFPPGTAGETILTRQ